MLVIRLHEWPPWFQPLLALGRSRPHLVASEIQHLILALPLNKMWIGTPLSSREHAWPRARVKMNCYSQPYSPLKCSAAFLHFLFLSLPYGIFCDTAKEGFYSLTHSSGGRLKKHWLRIKMNLIFVFSHLCIVDCSMLNRWQVDHHCEKLAELLGCPESLRYSWQSDTPRWRYK